MSRGDVGGWFWSTDEETFYGNHDFKDEALLAAFMDNPDTEAVWVGRTQEIPLETRIGAYQVMEGLIENLLDEAPEIAHGSWGDKLLEPAAQEEFKKLVTDFINKYEPPWWNEIGDIEKVLKIDWVEE